MLGLDVHNGAVHFLRECRHRNSAGGGSLAQELPDAASILDRYHTGLSVVVGVAVLGFAVVGASFFTRRPTPAEQESIDAEPAFEEAA